MRRATSLARSQRRHVLTILSLTLILAGRGVIEPLLLKYISDGLGQENALHYVAWGVGSMLALGVFREAASTLSSRLTWRTRLNLHYHLLDLTVARLHRLPHDIHRREGGAPPAEMMTEYAAHTRLSRAVRPIRTPSPSPRAQPDGQRRCDTDRITAARESSRIRISPSRAARWGGSRGSPPRPGR